MDEKELKRQCPKTPKIMFTVDSYDEFGTVYEKGIYIHFGDFASIKAGESIEDFRYLIEKLESMEAEIAENLKRR